MNQAHVSSNPQPDPPMSTIKLIPCPFCGDTEDDEFRPTVQHKVTELVFVGSCPICLCEGPSADSVNEAAKLWNTRPATRAAKLEEALREVLSGCKRCGGDGATLERPWAGAEHELNSCPDCGKYRELLSSPEAREDGWIAATFELCPDCKGDGHLGLNGEDEFNKCGKCSGCGYVGTPASKSDDGWIRVEDRLPEEEDWVSLCRDGCSHVEPARVMESYWIRWQLHDGVVLRVAKNDRWQSLKLPTPPTEGGAL